MKCERMDSYDYLIALSTLEANDDDVKMFMELDDSDVVLSDRITRKIKKLIRRESLCKAVGLISCKRILSKAAIITLVVISVMFTTLMSVSAIRTAVWEIITEWYEEYLSVGFVSQDDFEAKDPPKMIEEIRKPMLLPLGAEENVVGSTKNVFVCEYYVENQCYILFEQSLLKNELNKFDGDDANITKLTVCNHDARLFTYANDDYIYILWNDNEYAYTIASTIMSVEELISVAESVK